MSIQIETAPLVNVRVTSNLTSFTSERRFDRGITIADLKGRLELLTGASAGSMKLEVYTDKDVPVCSLADDLALLGSHCIEENYRIHVTDTQKRAGEFEDISKVEKFELAEDDYNQRSDTVRAFLMKNKLGKYNEEELKRMDQEKAAAEKAEEEKANSIHVGDRCEARITGEPPKRGVVMFVGKTHFKPGWWIGIKYDEPLGKNDGSIGGTRYFESPMKYGAFVRPANVETGDFPEIADELDEM